MCKGRKPNNEIDENGDYLFQSDIIYDEAKMSEFELNSGINQVNISNSSINSQMTRLYLQLLMPTIVNCEVYKQFSYNNTFIR